MFISTERLLKCRENSGLSKREAAKRIGVSQPAYVRYEAGDRQPSVHVIQNMALVFKTSVSYLTGESEMNEPESLLVKKDDNELLFYITYTCADFSQLQLHRVLTYLEKLKDTETTK